MTKTPLGRVTLALGIVVIAGWIWAFSNLGMPDTLWLVNVVLTAVTVVLIVATLMTGRKKG